MLTFRRAEWKAEENSVLYFPIYKSKVMSKLIAKNTIENKFKNI